MSLLATQIRPPYRADFEPSAVGKTAYFGLRWVNTPWQARAVEPDLLGSGPELEMAWPGLQVDRRKLWGWRRAPGGGS